MLHEKEYSDKIKQIFNNSKRITPETDFTKLSQDEIVQYGFLAGAKKIKSDLHKYQVSEYLNLPGIHMYTQCGLNPSELRFRGQNSIFFGSPGSGKTFLSAKLAKDYFCIQFIPEEYRESEKFFEGEYAQGITGNTAFRKIVFVSESHCLDMFSRNINNISAQEHFKGYPCYGSWDLDDLTTADLLVVQDIGSRKAHPSYAETLFSIFDHRFEDLSKTTIFTTNASGETLGQVYGEMFLDRIRVMLSATIDSDSKRALKRTVRTKQKFEFYTGE